MNSAIYRNTDVLHPLLKEDVATIKKLIAKHRLPFKLFETGRDRERQEWLMKTGKIKVPNLGHMYNLKNEPPLYCTAVSFVMNTGSRWSWNLRDNTVTAFYELFGNLVLDTCPNLEWGGENRKSKDYTLFTLKQQVVYDNLTDVPCVLA